MQISKYELSPVKYNKKTCLFLLFRTIINAC